MIREKRDEGNDQTQNGNDYTDAFTFDLAGNRHSMEHDAVGTANDETVTSSYNDRDQLTSEDSTINANDRAYAYDANGSMTSRGTDTFTWDLRNRMKSATVGGVVTAYGYDSSNQRISSKTDDDPTTYFINDASNPTGYPQIIEETTDGTSSRSYPIGNAVLGQSTGSGAATYFIRDGHGSNRALTDVDGVVTKSLDYQAFGEAIGFDPKLSGTIHTFAGDAEYDPATGGFYHDARWRWGHLFASYDSFEADPSSPADLHKYVYAQNNSTLATDPTGHLSLIELTIVVGIGITITGASLWIAGSYFNRPVLAGVGQSMTFFGAGVTLAGVGFMISPIVGAGVLATEIPLFIANLFYVWGEGGMVDRTRGVVASASVPQFLSDYYNFGVSQGRKLPPSGRIVVRGTTRFGDMPDSNGAKFWAAVPLLPGDYVYDYGLTSDGKDGGMAVIIGMVTQAGQIQVKGTHKFTSGTVSQLPFAQPLPAPPPEILVKK